MTTSETMLVRVYLTESRARLQRLLKLLRDSNKVSGVTVFKGIAGFGSTTAVDANLTKLDDPPVVLEFFDHPAAVQDTVAFIGSLVAPRHVVAWPVVTVTLNKK